MGLPSVSASKGNLALTHSRAGPALDVLGTQNIDDYDELNAS